MPGPQRGPIRQADTASTSMDPQMQAMVDKYGIDALRSMAKQQMQGGSATVLPTNQPVNMPSLPSPKGSRPSGGGGVRAGAPRKGSGFVNPGGVDPGAAAKANVAAMREQLLQKMAMMKLAGGAEGTDGTKAAEPAAAAPAAQVVQPQSAPVNTQPAAAPQSAYQPPTVAPAAQAVQPVSGWALFAGAVATAVVVGGGALLAAKLSDDAPSPVVRKVRR